MSPHGPAASEAGHTGSAGSGETEDVASQGSGERACEEKPAKDEGEDVCGDYGCVSPGCLQSLRLQPGGRWWHSAYRASNERLRWAEAKPKPSQYQSFVKAYKNSAFEEIPPDRDLASLKEEFEDVAVWELVESLGTWRFDAGFLTLSCQHWAWRASHLSAPHTLQPSEDGRSQLDELMDQQKLELCYKVSGETLALQTQGHPGWDLQQRHQRLRSLQSAFQSLGFAKNYTPGWPESGDELPSSSQEAR